MKFKEGDWIRKCDECCNKQIDNKPSLDKELSISYRNRKCKKCKSEALDYGQTYTEKKPIDDGDDD